MQGEACVSCGRKLQAESGVLACAACGASQVPWKNRHRTTEEYGRLDLKPWRASSNSANSAAAATVNLKKPPAAQSKAQPARPPWKPVGGRANSAMFVKAAAAADSLPPHVTVQDERAAEMLDSGPEEHAESAEVVDGDGKVQGEEEADGDYRQEDKMEVTALGVYELEEVLGDCEFAGCSVCVYLIHKQCFSKRKHRSQNGRSTTLADCIVSHRLLQGWCLRIDVVRQDGDSSGEEQLLLQRHVPESVFRLITPSKLFLPLGSIDPMCPYMSQHLSDVLRPLVLRLHKCYEANDLAFDDTAARFGARIQWGSWFAPRYTPAAVTLKILHDRGAALIDGVVDQCEAEKFADVEAKNDAAKDNFQISEQLIHGLQLEVWPLESRFGGCTALDISLQTLNAVATTTSTPIRLYQALVQGDRRSLLQLARAVIAQYQFVNTRDGPLLLQSAGLAEPGNSLRYRIIPWAEDMEDADEKEEADQKSIETASHHEDDETEDFASSQTIQRFVRGWLARRRVAELARRQKAEREEAEAEKEAQRRRWLQRRHEAAIVIQCIVRRRMAVQRLLELQQRRPPRFLQFEYEHYCLINATDVKLVASFEGFEEEEKCFRDEANGATCVRRSVLQQGSFQLKLQAFDEQSRQHSNELLLPGSRVQALLLPDVAAAEENQGFALAWIVQQIAQHLTLFYSKANSLMVLALPS